MSSEAVTAAPVQLVARGLRRQAATEKIYTPRRPASIFPRGTKTNLYDMAANLIGKDTAITYLEFGVFRGWSLGQIARRFTNPDTKLYGFDSFEGLPEAWGGLMPRHFAIDDTPTLSDGRAALVKGYFQNTVAEFLASNPVAGPALVHFDADLYSSTLFLLTVIWHHIPNYYFLFDEFVPDEVIALHDFASAYPVEIEFFGAVENEKGHPLQTFGHLRRVVFSV